MASTARGRWPGGHPHWRSAWPPIYGEYPTALRQARPADATREFVRILHLHARYRPEAIAAALEQALPLACWSADAVEILIRQAADPATVARALDLTAVPRLAPLAAVTIPVPDLHAFDHLLTPNPTEVTR